jgi:general L-amino acid transport system permease protein
MSETSGFLSAEGHAAVPLWRDVRVLRWAFQIVVLLLAVALIYVLGNNLTNSLEDVGLNLSFRFLSRPAGFNIGEGPPFDRSETMFRAYLVGVVNTLRAAGIGILLATILGVFVGIARLSHNWLVSRIALVYIEIMQNTPLLVQLFFWFTLIRALPAQRFGEILSLPTNPIRLGPVEIPPLAYFSQRAAALPGIEALDTFSTWRWFVLLALAVAAAAWHLRIYLSERAGHPPTGQLWWAAASFVVVCVAGWLVAGNAPLRVTIPALEGAKIVKYRGGWVLTNNFQALLLGLVLYTAAFIAEAVRSGIQSVPYGQIEAATALGLKRGQQLRLIILPQAMRVTIPPLINQYLNLTKNSSLAIAVAYPDLFNISQTIGNQSGQNTQIIMMVMAAYLSMSLSISLLMNFINRRMQIKER